MLQLLVGWVVSYVSAQATWSEAIRSRDVVSSRGTTFCPSYDYVKIYPCTDSTCSSMTLNETMYGDGQGNMDVDIESTKNVMRVEFKSDGTQQYDGFSATFGQTSVAVTTSIQFSSAYTRAKVSSGSIRLELEVAIDILMLRINTISLEDDSSAPQFAEVAVIVEFTATLGGCDEGSLPHVHVGGLQGGRCSRLQCGCGPGFNNPSHVHEKAGGFGRGPTSNSLSNFSAAAEVRQVLETTIISAQSSGSLESYIATEIKASTGADPQVTLVL